MSIENASYIHQLDAANPSSTDLVADGDNHLRLIKQTLKNTFPNIQGVVSATHIQMGAYVPTGGIILWSGATNAIPAGWVLCNGQTAAKADGTGNITAPDLRDRFVVGAGGGYTVNQTGGNLSQVLATASGGSHTHTGTSDAGGNHDHGGSTAGHALTIGQIPSHTHTFTVQQTQNTGAIGIGGGQGFSLNTGGGTTAATGSGEAHLHAISFSGAHTHAFTTAAAGDHTHSFSIGDMRPPFFALAYIMKL